MDPLKSIEQGFGSVAADEALKSQALTNLDRWLTRPEFAVYRPQLEWLIKEKRWPGLLDRFFQVLPFGTGGRRGAVGVGPNRMNFWTLGASVQGHCEYLKEKFPEIDSLHVVLAYDVRRFEDVGRNYDPALPHPMLHKTSRDLAQYAAGVYVANGIHVHILSPDSPHFMATPELSLAIRRLHAHGGLNVSASHNPPDDNGGKFYDERGAQPVPPDDQIMSDLVEQVGEIRELTWTDAVRSGKVRFLDASNHRAYIDLCRKQSLLTPPKFDELKVVFTPLHGVGGTTAYEVLEHAGFRPMPVPEQMEPNGLFPNVTKAPNPEVPESFDRGIAVARKHEADLVLATDPDADRLGAVVHDGAGEFRFLTGNEIACLIAHFKFEQLTRQGRMPTSPVLLTTEVTTRMLTQIARHFAVQVIHHLLVGFKNIAEVIRLLEQDGTYEDVTGRGEDFVFGAEEAHGILVTPEMRDKDGASAVLLLAEAALEQKRQGRTLLHYLADLHRQFGYFRNELRSLIKTGIEGRSQMQQMMASLRSDPPSTIAQRRVTTMTDLRDEGGRFGPLRGATDAAGRNVLLFQLGADARIAIRPSGTEPKAKIYVEIQGPPATPRTSAEAWHNTCRAIDQEAARLADEFAKLALNRAGAAG